MTDQPRPSDEEHPGQLDQSGTGLGQPEAGADPVPLTPEAAAARFQILLIGGIGIAAMVLMCLVVLVLIALQRNG